MTRRNYKEQQQEILHNILDLCKHHFAIGAEIHQEPYKEDYLRLCADAYKRRFCGEQFGYFEDDPDKKIYRASPVRPQIWGDTIWAFAKQDGWVEAEMDPQNPKYILIQQVIDWWDSWVYAWDRQPKKRQVPPRKLRRTTSIRGK